jgi:hypothetical protein
VIEIFEDSHFVAVCFEDLGKRHRPEFRVKLLDPLIPTMPMGEGIGLGP